MQSDAILSIIFILYNLLGCALVQIPDMITKLYKQAKKMKQSHDTSRSRKTLEIDGIGQNKMVVEILSSATDNSVGRDHLTVERKGNEETTGFKIEDLRREMMALFNQVSEKIDRYEEKRTCTTNKKMTLNNI